MAALLGALPLALEQGTGSELRRPLGISIVGGLLLSQFLTLYTTPVIYLYLDRLANWVQRGAAPMRGVTACRREPSRCRGGSKPGLRHEHLRAIHPPAGGHFAAGDRACFLLGIVAYHFLPVAPIPRVDFPMIIGFGLSARRGPGHGRLLPGRAAGTAAWARLPASSEMTSVSTLGGASDHPSIRSESQRGRRGARCAGGHQCRRRRSADQPARPAHLSQGQPGRRADHDSGDDLGHAAGHADL